MEGLTTSFCCHRGIFTSDQKILIEQLRVTQTLSIISIVPIVVFSGCLL